MPNINAALGCAQLEQLTSFLENKRNLAKDYEIFFKEKGLNLELRHKGLKQIIG